MKLPHWVAAATALAIVVITWIMNQAASGALVIPAAVLTALTVGKTVLQLFTDNVAGGTPASGSKAVAAPAPSTGGPVPPAAARTWTAPAVRKSGVFRVFAFPVAAAFLSACSLFGTVEAPVVDCGTRVAADAAKGLTIVQIVADVAAPCSMDLAAVVAALLASKDSAVASSKAFVEAARVQAVSVEAAKGKP